MSLSKFCGFVRLSTPSLGEKPNQPRLLKFPQRKFCQKTPVKRSFQPQWFDRWPWIHYDESSDAAFCFLCVKTYSQPENYIHFCRVNYQTPNAEIQLKAPGLPSVYFILGLKYYRPIIRTGVYF